MESAEISGNLPIFQEKSSQFIDAIDIGQNSIPSLVDIDADGDYDLFNGAYVRNRIYRNNGLGFFLIIIYSQSYHSQGNTKSITTSNSRASNTTLEIIRFKNIPHGMNYTEDEC